MILRSSPRSGSRPPVATRRSHPRRRMRSTCHPTFSFGSGCGTKRSPPTSGHSKRELEGDLLLALGRYASARTAYEATLRREPGRPRSLFGLARAAELAGDVAAARAGYRAYLARMRQGDGERAELAIARGALSDR